MPIAPPAHRPRLATLKSRLNTVTTHKPASKPERWSKGRGGRPWRRLVEAVKVRDKYTCQACGRLTLEGECDHVVPECKGGKSELSNLQWLCKKPCHADKTAREAAEAQGYTVKPKAVIGADGWPV
jgi:5-methylcytosine-specific restriction protein A